MIRVKEALKQAVEELSSITSGDKSQTSSPSLDAQLLLASVMGLSRTMLYAYPEKILTSNEYTHFQTLIRKRLTGIPVAYLIGKREFWSLPLTVSEHTLIPRPETELLVDVALGLLPKELPACVLDLGTGSGAVALAIAFERPHWQLIASDVSRSALAIATHNAKKLSIQNISFYCSDWFTHLPSQLHDAIVANPPYIPLNDPHLQQGDVQFEPPNALVSGVDGLAALRHIIQNSQPYLKKGGWLLLEHGFDQATTVRQLFADFGYRNIQSWKDIQAHYRVTGATF